MKIRLDGPAWVTRGRAVGALTILVCLLLASVAQSAFAVTPILTVDNAGFETWAGNVPTDWTIQAGGTTQASASPHSGTFAFSFNDPNTYPLTARMLAPGGSLTEGFPVDQYRWYRFSAWAQSDRGAAAPELVLWFENSSGTMIGTTQYARGDQFGVTSSTWKQMEIKRQAPSGATKMVVQLGMYGGTGGGVRFDDVQLDEVNAQSGETDSYHGWTVTRSADLGSGFGNNVPGGGVVSFTAPGGVGYELNGNSLVGQTFPRPIESLSFTVTFSPLWDANRLQPIVWSNPTVTGVPYVLGIYTPAGGNPMDVTLRGPNGSDGKPTSLNTRHVDLTCSAVRGPSDDFMDVTFSKLRALAPVWRFRNRASGFYLMTADPTEMKNIKNNLAGTWAYEGPAYQVNLASEFNTSPLWRFRNIKGGYYLYTADPAEKTYIQSNLAKTWKYEGESYRVSMKKTDPPVWRFYNRQNGTYLYTADKAERDYIYVYLPLQWKYEGPAYYLSTY